MSTPHRDSPGGDASTASDLREFPRVSSRCLVNYKPVGDDPRIDAIQNGGPSGLLQNISGGGVCVRMPEEPEMGSLLALTIQLPNMPTSVISIGKVVWTSPQDSGECDVGIEFWWVGWEDRNVQESIRGFISDTLNDDR